MKVILKLIVALLLPLAAIAILFIAPPQDRAAGMCCGVAESCFEGDTGQCYNQGEGSYKGVDYLFHQCRFGGLGTCNNDQSALCAEVWLYSVPNCQGQPFEHYYVTIPACDTQTNPVCHPIGPMTLAI